VVSGKGKPKMRTSYNRRQHRRRPARFSVKYTIQSGTYRDLVGNVSAGGVFVMTRREILTEQKISLQFPVFAFDNRPSVLGTVVRSNSEGFAVMFNKPFMNRLCPDDHFSEDEPEKNPSKDVTYV
jgi:hypothetical protein